MSDFYNNLGLYKDLSKCEENLLELINFNFFKLDSTWQLKVIDIVEDLPLSAQVGDVYILTTGIYSQENFYAIFDGEKWVYVPVQQGHLFYLESQGDFYSYDGFEFFSFTSRFGNVINFSYSENNQVARFDGESGKIIKNSLVTINDDGVIFTPTSIYADTLNVEKISSDNYEIINLGGGSAQIEGLINTFVVADAEQVFDDLVLSPEFNLNSSFIFTIKNGSGGNIYLSPFGNIDLGYPEMLTLNDGGSLFVMFDSSTQRFSVLKESQGGRKILIVEDEAERDAIPDEYREDGLVVYEKSGQTTTQLQGGISNLNWNDFGSGGGAGGGSLSLSAPQNIDIMPAIEDNFQGIPTYLIDENSVGVCVSFIIPPNFDESKHDLSINFPVLCNSLGANSIDFKVSLMQSGDTSPSDATDAFPIESSPVVGMYKLLKLPIFPAFEQPIEAGMLCMCTLSSRASGTQFASSWHFLKTGSFISMEKK